MLICFYLLQILDENREEKTVLLTAKGFVETVRCLSGLTGLDSQDQSKIAVAAIIPAHHQALGE